MAAHDELDETAAQYERYLELSQFTRIGQATTRVLEPEFFAPRPAPLTLTLIGPRNASTGETSPCPPAGRLVEVVQR